ncbi:hypothetical protein GCM10011414_10860 [Croceivirga lutea]|uniref:hypothetical protein n=1 Tax=Croceivirga lutea TaxID=1775167 RepID=UPI001639B1F4|nr:hypothetical protein [Croceivirga lutea]GGG43063.1 hypothetical protein GCM10011414_10860 [Croceivirga lutea]
MWQVVTNTNQVQKVEDLHWEIQHLKSKIQFLDNEVLFLKRLLESYVFEPNTLKLFKRFEVFKRELTRIDKIRLELINNISKHENNLAGMYDSINSSCDKWSYQKHTTLKGEVDEIINKFRELKSSVFNYAQGILKNRRP